MKYETPVLSHIISNALQDEYNNKYGGYGFDPQDVRNELIAAARQLEPIILADSLTQNAVPIRLHYYPLTGHPKKVTDLRTGDELSPDFQAPLLEAAEQGLISFCLATMRVTEDGNLSLIAYGLETNK